MHACTLANTYYAFIIIDSPHLCIYSSPTKKKQGCNGCLQLCDPRFQAAQGRRRAPLPETELSLGLGTRLNLTWPGIARQRNYG